MPDQNQKHKLLILLTIVIALGAAIFVVIRQMPGKFQSFEYEKVFDSPAQDARIGKVTKRITLEGFHPHQFSVGQWQAQTVIALSNRSAIHIIDTDCKIITSITIDTEPTAIKMIGPAESPRLITAANNKLQIIGLEKNDLIFSLDIPNDKALISSITANDNYIYAADAQAKCIWQINLPLNEELKDYDPDGTTICPLGTKQFVLPSAHFEIKTAINGTDIWAANTGNHRLDKYSPDIAEPTDSWGHPSFQPDGFAGCCNPASFTILADGKFVTAEKGNVQVKLFSESGRYMSLIVDRRDFLRPEAFKTMIFPMVDSIPSEPDSIYILDTTTESILVVDIQ